jgi:hypothetical protein
MKNKKDELRSYEDEIKKLYRETNLERLKENIDILKAELKELKRMRTYLPVHDPMIKMLERAISLAEKNKIKIEREQAIAHKNKQDELSKEDDRQAQRSLEERAELELVLKNLRKEHAETHLLLGDAFSIIRNASLVQFMDEKKDELQKVTADYNARHPDRQPVTEREMAESLQRKADNDALRLQANAPEPEPGLSLADIVTNAERQYSDSKLSIKDQVSALPDANGAKELVGLLGNTIDLVGDLLKVLVVERLAIASLCKLDPSLSSRLQEDPEEATRLLKEINDTQKTMLNARSELESPEPSGADDADVPNVPTMRPSPPGC